VIVWLMDAVGPGMAAGVTDSETSAITNAEALMEAGRAISARVEFAYARIGGASLEDGYQRTGTGWSLSRCPDGIVTWTPLTQAPR
jgi:hypothetical protein